MKRPFVYLNLAMTADGKIATANRAVSSFSSHRDFEHMMELRAQADAVMSGARTVDMNAVTLGPGSAKYRRARMRGGLAEFNIRVVVSRLGTINPNAEIFRKTFSPILILTTERASKRRLKTLRTLATEVKPCGRREIDFAAALRWLRGEWEIRRLLCEGGGELNDALFRADLVDELHLTVCPKLFGGRDAPTVCDGIGARSLAEATPLRLKSMRRHKNELFLVYARFKGTGRRQVD